MAQHHRRAGERRTKTLPRHAASLSLTLGDERSVLLAAGMMMIGVQHYRMVVDDDELVDDEPNRRLLGITLLGF